MKNPIKKVAAIHDISGYGRAALTSIIPILASMGHQVCPLPTAVLSTNTGYFEDFTFVDLTDSMSDYIEHWKKINMEFECIYTGFIGSAKQVDIIIDFLDFFKKENTLMVVDPVMGDDGKLYPTITEEIVEAMKNLVSMSDIITPNFTEAKYLLGEEAEEIIGETEIKEVLVRLADLGPEVVIITSVPDNIEEDTVSVYAYEKTKDRFWKVSSEYIPAEYPGTGDSFTSILIGSILNGDSIPVAINKSAKFISLAIKESYGYDYPHREGILLERSLGVLNAPFLNIDYKRI